MYFLKRLLALLFILIFVACKKEKLYFQKIEVVESRTDSRLNRIQYINDSICIIAGGERFLKAEILRSTDGGRNWTNYTFPEVGKGIYEIGVSPTGTIYLSAFDGKMLISRDNGENWDYKEIGNWEFHIGVSFAGNDRIVMVNTDGQKASQVLIADSSINIKKTTDFEFGLNDVQMVNAQTGYIAGYGVIMKSTDGGDNWTILDVKNDNFNALSCISENEVWATGYNGSIVHTNDGGQTWERMRNGNNIIKTRYHFKNIRFRDAMNGWAVGENGLVVYTNDGGNNWTQYNTFTDVALLDLSFCPDGTILVVGEAGKIYRLTP